MPITPRDSLRQSAEAVFGGDAATVLSYLPGRPFDSGAIRCVMINEVVADAPANDFYSDSDSPAYMETTRALFQKAGADVQNIDDITRLGIYVTSAVKLPKTESAVSADTLARCAPFLAEELALFPNVRAVMLMGDVARKAFNLITKAKTGKNAVPTGSTYKLRSSETYYGDLRLFPAYIMTGKNILIEKSKVEMSAEEIAKMLAHINS
jgi:uracil-DNA glycosylase